MMLRVDINNIAIDMSAAISERKRQYLAQIKNPHKFKCGDIAVNVEFASNGRRLKAAIADYLSYKKNEPNGEG
jgi:hypothetical protein